MKEVNHSKIKETNRKKIIRLLLNKDEITKLDISRELDISITTVSTNITELKNANIVENVRMLESTGGRKAIAIKLKENSRYSIGIALTPKHIKICLVNLKKMVIKSIKVRHENNGIEKIVNLINENIKQLFETYCINEDNLLGVCFSLPGTVDSDLGIVKRCYLLGINDYNLREKFRYLNVPIYIDNEANLSAYYEFLTVRDTLKNLLYVSITDGVGLGIIIKGKIYRGDNNSAGELGHIKVVVGGKECKCGSKGCFEAYTSVNALLESYNEVSQMKIHDIDVFENEYKNRNVIAKKVMDQYIDMLGVGMSNLIMLLDPSSIIIGGEINNLIQDNIDKLKRKIYEGNVFSDETRCSINVTKFKDVYLLGASMVPIEEFLDIK